MTHTAGFNAGVEAAAAWLENCAEACDASADLKATASNCRIMATQIHALKRPEPSEDDVLKVAQAIRQQIPDAEPIAIEAAARAALAAMRENG